MAARRIRLARARKAAGYTQEQLAEAMDADRSTVARWESGESEPQPYKRAKLARLLGVNPDTLERLLGDDGPKETMAERRRPGQPTEVGEQSSGSRLLPVALNGRTVLLALDAPMIATSGLSLASQGADGLAGEIPRSGATAAQWEAMSPLNRRALLKHGLAVAALPALGLEELQQVAAAMDDARRYFDGSVLEYFRRHLDACKSDDGTLGPKKTLPVVLGILGAVEEHAREVKPHIRRDLLTLGAEAAEFAGWLYRDVRDLSRSLYWHDRATEWAQEAGDTAMCGYVLLKKAQVAFDEREPLRMLTLAQAVQAGPWGLPQRVHAEAVQQEARAEAMLGASADAVNRKLDRAWELLGASEDEPSTLGAHYNATLLTMQTAICYAEAGAPRQAVELYTQSLSEASFSIRDYGFFLSLMAGSLALAGEPDQAAATGLESATRATDTSSHRTTQELTRVVEYLKPWQNRPAVKQLQEVIAG